IHPPAQPSTPASQAFWLVTRIAAHAGTAFAMKPLSMRHDLFRKPVPTFRVLSLRYQFRRGAMTFRPRRSVLYMPGSNARAIEKARTLPADGVILDLEDAVAPEAKEQARQTVADAVKAGGFGGREVFIRVNGIESPWHADDLYAAAHAGPDGILVPKVGQVDTLELIGQRLLDMKCDLKTRVWAMIETPEAIFNINALAAKAHDSETRLAGFVMGTNDLAKQTRARLVPGRAPMMSWLARCLLAAH